MPKTTLRSGKSEAQVAIIKFWWDEELRLLKAASVDAKKPWKAAGKKPRHGSVYNARQCSRKGYRARLRNKQAYIWKLSLILMTYMMPYY